METSKYLIIGGGMVAAAAVKGIREADESGSITIVGTEPDPPYTRPWLTKGLWKGKSLEKVWKRIPQSDLSIKTGRTITSLDTNRKRATDDQGDVYEYTKALIATGSRPRPFSMGGEHVINFRTLDDYRRIRELAVDGSRIAVIGGGFIGSEMAAALNMNGVRTTLIFPDRTICSRIFPVDLGLSVNEMYQQKGVTVRSAERVTDIDRSGNTLIVTTKNQSTRATVSFEVDGIVAGIGHEPIVDFAKSAGIRVDDGILVDENLTTSAADVYAAGDVASFEQPELGGRRRVEHEDNANVSGRIAGLNMAGRRNKYHHLPMFYSDLFDMGYEAVGDIDSRLETVADWKTPMKEGVIYYLDKGKVNGVLLWNVWEQVDAARKLISIGKKVAHDDLMGLLPAK